MKKLLLDLLATNGKWSFKRVTAIYVLNVSIVYAFTPAIFPKFEVMEFVMMALIGYSASMVGMTVWQKSLDSKSTTNE
jgi:hypothetical protein